VKANIEDKMFWSPWVNLSDITVAVANGIATLTGTADSWFEFNKATESAYEGGASQVHNASPLDKLAAIMTSRGPGEFVPARPASARSGVGKTQWSRARGLGLVSMATRLASLRRGEDECFPRVWPHPIGASICSPATSGAGRRRCRRRRSTRRREDLRGIDKDDRPQLGWSKRSEGSLRLHAAGQELTPKGGAFDHAIADERVSPQ